MLSAEFISRVSWRIGIQPQLLGYHTDILMINSVIKSESLHMIDGEQSAVLHFFEVICERIPAQVQLFAYFCSCHRRVPKKYPIYIISCGIAYGLRE